MKLLAFAGSARHDSFNHALVEVAAAHAREAGAEVRVVRIKDYAMPIYDGDLEAQSGIPQLAKDFKALLRESDGWLIASPEYNSAYSALLKNAIDWASRAEHKNETPLAAFRNTCAGLMAASPGALGGLRGLVSLRMLLGNLGVFVLPRQVVLAHADKAFANGKLVDEKKDAEIKNLATMLLQTATKLQ